MYKRGEQKVKVPGYLKHKPTGQARVRINGRDHYLGRYGSKESKERYDRLIAEYKASGGSAAFGKPEPLVQELLLSYVRFAKTYYGPKELSNMKTVIRDVQKLYGSTKAKDFGAVEFKAVRAMWLESGRLARNTVNKQAGRMLRIFRWAVAEGAFPPGNVTAMECVAPLMPGRCGNVRETEPVGPVSLETVEATLPHLTPVLQDMVRLQLYTGARPGELVRITPGMVDRSGEIWEIHFREHKTAHRGRLRIIPVGPRGQGVLSKYLLRGEDEPCFSPKESEKQRRQAAHEARTTAMNQGNRPGYSKRSRLGRNPRTEPGDRYTTGSYGRAIEYGCRRAFPPPESIKGDREKVRDWQRKHHWAPNQLRHRYATDARKLKGLEYAQAGLGHAEVGVTQFYAQVDRQKAIELARLIG